MAARHFLINGKSLPCPAEVEKQGPVAMQAWLEAERAAVKAGKSELWNNAAAPKRPPRPSRFKAGKLIGATSEHATAAPSKASPAETPASTEEK